jgi:phenolic acid decarboxylase
MSHKVLLNKSGEYELSRDRFGNYEITKDGKSVYLQGDDAIALEVHAGIGDGGWLPDRLMEPVNFTEFCADYKEQMA